jgi:hypothetical protein
MTAKAATDTAMMTNTLATLIPSHLRTKEPFLPAPAPELLGVAGLRLGLPSLLNNPNIGYHFLHKEHHTQSDVQCQEQAESHMWNSQQWLESEQ